MRNRRFRKSIRIVAAALLLYGMAAGAGNSSTTVDPVDKYSWGPNIGWLNWEGDGANGARFTNRIASGYIYGSNVGWIFLGSGTPLLGLRYTNVIPGDTGVTVDDASDPNYYILKGYAYGANIGWIVFDVQAQAGAANQPRIEKATGVLKGFAWSPNAGWLPLESPGIAQVKTSVIEENRARRWSLYR